LSALESNVNVSKAPLYISWVGIEPGLVALSKPGLQVFGQVNASLWLATNTTILSNVNVTAGLYFQYIAPAAIHVASVTKKQELNSTRRVLEMSFTVNGYFYPEASNIVLAVNATSNPSVSVSMYYGSPSRDSVLKLPVSSYADIGPGPVLIEDVNGTVRNTFYVNWTSGNNFVKIVAPVRNAFGLSDIARVNITIIGPSLQPVPSYLDLNMTHPPDSEGNPLSLFSFRFDRSSTLGNYRVYIDIIDIEGNRVKGPRGDLYTFGLDKTPFFVFPQPQDIIPYAAGAGGVAIAGFVYLQRRKKREYLAPFDHFYTLSGGPFASGSMVMIEGNTGSGKSLLAQQLMYDDLRSGKPCIFVSTADFPSKIRGAMKSLGFETDPYEGREYLRFVDCYSAEAGQPSQEKFYISSLSDLTSLGVKITSAISNPGEFPSVFFDSLTPLTPKSKPENIVSFAQAVGAKVRGVGGKAYFTVGSGTEPSILRNLEESSDCVIQMEAFEEKGIRRRRMRITKFRNRRFHEGWVTFTVEEGKGIIFYSKKPKR
jgi:KaiC/GvpD/RAD55 family RecA-like ATPase